MSYAGDKSCRETWQALETDENAVLVDVRTTREWDVIGVPDLSSIGKDALFVEWQMFPAMDINPDFAGAVDTQLKAMGRDRNVAVFCLCRSGVRSKAAAAALTALGYARAYNIDSGFEGIPDENGERAKINGWQHDGLPWKQKG